MHLIRWTISLTYFHRYQLFDGIKQADQSSRRSFCPLNQVQRGQCAEDASLALSCLQGSRTQLCLYAYLCAFQTTQQRESIRALHVHSHLTLFLRFVPRSCTTLVLSLNATSCSVNQLECASSLWQAKTTKSLLLQTFPQTGNSLCWARTTQAVWLKKNRKSTFFFMCSESSFMFCLVSAKGNSDGELAHKLFMLYLFIYF